jgi:type II secretory pathway component PulF
MHQFCYKAKNEKGEFVDGTISATSETDAIKQLSSQNIYPLSIKKSTESISSQRFSLSLGQRASSKDLYTFTSQLAYLLKGGLPLLRGLELLRAQMKVSGWQRILTQLIETINQGGSFSDSLAACKGIFSKFYVSMVRSGEAGGTLDSVLERLAVQIEKENDLKAKVLQALLYPSVIVCVGIVTVMVMMLFVIPKMSLMYEELDQALPFITQMLINVSTALAAGWWLVLGGLVALVFATKTVMRSARSSTMLGALILKVPLFGPLFMREELVRFTRVLGMLLHNGVPMLESLSIVQEVLGNAIFKTIVSTTRDVVQQGSQISAVLDREKVFPPLFVHMVAIGEETGTLDASLDKVADIYEKEVERHVKTITTLIEPFLILVIGGVVGLIAIAMFLPVFQLNLLAQ